MHPVRLVGKITIAGLLVATTGFAGDVAATVATHALACATVTVTAKPHLNTQAGSDETIQNQITNCSAKLETVQLKQQLGLPGAFSATFALAAHGHVEITQHIHYRCCGTYNVTDQVFSTSGTLLGTAHSNWTDA